MAKQSTDILTWARRGAEARWNELQAEVASLLKTFPDLASVSTAATIPDHIAASGPARSVPENATAPVTTATNARKVLAIWRHDRYSRRFAGRSPSRAGRRYRAPTSGAIVCLAVQGERPVLYWFYARSLRLNNNKRRTIADDQLFGAACDLSRATVEPVMGPLGL